MAKMATHRWVSRIAACAGLVLAVGCGQTGGGTTAGGTGESTGSSTTGTTGGTTAGSTGSMTEGGGSEGQTESGSTTQPATTTATGSSSGGETSSSSGGETSSSGGETSSSSGGETSSSSGGKDLCEDFEEPGCIHKGCPEGQKCDTQVDCVPSSCSCDPQTGDILCTADCGGGTCVGGLDCEPVACNLFCEFGFKTDEKGCEICECNEPPPPNCGCASDADCVKASPGCCSCNMGGTEVAVAKACLDQLEPCPLPPDEVVCPAVYKCTDAQAVCVNKQCVLQ